MSRYLASLSTLISLDKLPDSLGFLQSDIESVFDNVYYDHYLVTTSRRGEIKTYNLDIILQEEFGFEIPGTGISLLLNPALPGALATQTSFNITLTYRFGVLQFINNFNLANFSFQATDLINILLRSLDLNPTVVLEQVSTHMVNTDGEIGYLVYDIAELVAFFNDYYELTGTEYELTFSDTTTYGDVETELGTAGITTADVILEFEITTDYPNGQDTIEDVYSKLDVEKDTGPLPIPDLITKLNTDYNLTGTSHEIIYTDNPQTTYDEIVAALTSAGISELDLITTYIVNDLTDYGDIENAVTELFTEIQGDGGVNFVGLFDPFVDASINNLALALEFPRSALNPIDPTTNQPYVDQNIKSMLRFDVGSVGFSTTDGFTFDGEDAFSFDKSEIANTGLILSFTNAILDLSTTSNISEATAAGYPNDFVGVYVQQAFIGFNTFGTDDPNHVSASITGNNLLIGTGGISGTLTLADSGVLYRNFGTFAAEIDTFSLTFRQNAIVNSSVSGLITLDKFTTNGLPSKIAIKAQFKDSGDFSITASPSANFPPLTLPGVFDLYVRTLTLGEEQPKGFYVEVSGTINFSANIPVLGDVLPKGVSVNKLRIWQDGSIDFHGGSIPIPTTFKLKIGPVKMEVNKMSTGSYNRIFNGVSRNYGFFGFDGMINVGNAGIEASGNGIKFYFTIDDGPDRPFDCFVRIDSIAVDITVPSGSSAKNADFILKGMLKVGTPNPLVSTSTVGTEYSGSVSVTLPKLSIAGSAGMRLDPDIPSFLVDLQMELATPLPLGASTLGVYGFRGLIGEHYLPSKSATQLKLPETASWWDYYKAKNVPDGLEGIEVDKFVIEPGFSLGAGIAIAEELQGGFVFSAKLFLLLGLPDVFLIQGQAGILRKRIGLSDKTDPPFSALIAIDSTSFTGNLSVNYKLPADGGLSGKITSLQGTLAMAFYFNNASGWYLDVGKDQPTSARVQAQILTLFKGYAYLMISAQGFKFGAGASIGFSKKFGPVGVSIGASLDLGAFVSFTPVQIGGFIQFGGYANLKLFWLKIGISVQIALAVEAPHPFNIDGSLQVKIHTPWPLPNIKFQLEVSWHISNDNSPLLVPIAILDLPDPAAGYTPAVAINIMSQESFPVNYVNQQYSGAVNIPAPGATGWQYNFNDTNEVMQVTIPLDSYIDIALLKPVIPGQVALGGANSQLPVGYTELLPPVKGISKQVKHSYTLNALNIYAWNGTGSGGGSWVPYQIYEAVTAIVNDNTGDNEIPLDTLPAGYWQFTDPGKYTKIRLMSQTMFTYANLPDVTLPNLDGLNFQRKDLFCYETVLQENDVNWKGEIEGTVYAAGSTNMISGVSFTFYDLDGKVQIDPTFTKNSLLLQALSGSMVIVFPETVTTYELDFGPNQNHISVYPVVINHLIADFGQAVSYDSYLTPSVLAPSAQPATIKYNNAAQPVNKVLLVIDNVYPPDFKGDLNIGGYFQLPDQFLPVTIPQFHHEYDAEKSLMYATLFNKSFTAQEVMQKQYDDNDGIAGQWILNSRLDDTGHSNGLISGDPSLVAGFYQRNNTSPLQLQSIYAFEENSDALIIPYNSTIEVETGSFAVEITAVFNPYAGGISTLLSKVITDPVGGSKGFALHLYQQTPGDPTVAYTNQSDAPTFNVWFTVYQGTSSSGIMATESYTINLSTSRLADTQYEHIFVSVDRVAGTVSLYIDRVLKISTAIPIELGIVDVQPLPTYIDQLSYFTEEVQARQDDNPITQDLVINELQMLGDGLNKTIQPVWRPNTTFAITVTTTDTVNGNTAGAVPYTQIFGFQTAGPVGNFQQQSAVYQALLQQDQADQFKVADLTGYIDYDRSSPDAQGRYNLSKPVFCQNPQINLVFLFPYIYAMYANWDSYQGLPAIQSSLQIQLVDPYGAYSSPVLIWTQMPDEVIDIDNYRSLPLDQQLIFLLDQAAADDSCNPHPISLTKRIKQGIYQFPDPLSPNKIYTAIFNAIYEPAGQGAQTTEVHKYSFLSSLFNTFQEQVGSFVLNDTAGAEQYAIYPLYVAFTTDQLNNTIIPLLADDPENASALILQYAIKYDRIVYGGLQLKSFEPSANTIINPVINVNSADQSHSILGVIIRNPEPFNDPKLPVAELANTVQLTLTQIDQTVIKPDQFTYIHAGDTSAVLITNPSMQVAAGNIQFTIRYKIFNGSDYDTAYEEYTSPVIGLAAE